METIPSFSNLLKNKYFLSGLGLLLLGSIVSFPAVLNISSFRAETIGIVIILSGFVVIISIASLELYRFYQSATQRRISVPEFLPSLPSGKTKVMVTGAAGFMGSHLVDYLLNEGHEVYGVDDLSGGYLYNVNPQSHFTKLDLREREATRILVEQVRPQVIYHLAADATEGRSQFTPINCTERNYLAYLHLLIPAIKNGMEKMVVCSSMSVYGAQKPPFSEEMEPAPEDIYAISKTAMEKATKILSEVHGFKYTIFRPHNVFGPRQNLADPYRNVIGIFINCLLHDRNFYIYGDGEQKRSFSYIDDVTPYIAKAGFMDKTNGEIFNIGPREEHTINEMAREVLSNFVDDPDNPPEHLRPKYLPARPKEVREAFCTCEKAEKILGYQTTVELSEGVRKMVEWAKSIGPQKFNYLESLELETKETPVTWKEKLI